MPGNVFLAFVVTSYELDQKDKMDLVDKIGEIGVEVNAVGVRSLMDSLGK